MEKEKEKEKEKENVLTEEKEEKEEKEGKVAEMVSAAETVVAASSDTGSGASSDASGDSDDRSWTEQQVAAWLANIGTAYADAKYGDAFLASGVNGELLLDGIKEEDLVELGAKKHDARRFQTTQCVS